MKLRLHKPSPAMVVACAALFVALGGVSTAAVVVLKKNSVLSKHIKNGQVKSVDLGANAVNSSKVGDGSLLTQDFAPGQLPKGDQGERGPAGSDAQFTGAAAGGDLAGTYPNPSIRADEQWQEVGTPGQPQFINGWVNLGGGWATTAFYKDRNGIVHLKGLLNTTGHTVGETVFYLPYSHGPCDGRTHLFGTQSGTGTGRVDIGLNVALVPAVTAITYTTNSHLSLEGITFRADDC